MPVTTTTTDELLAEILRDPDDLGPRRVLADLLIQQADPRGELITVQCEGHDFPCEAELLAKHGKQWLGKLGKLATQPVFRRGFVEQITSTCINFIANGAALVKLFPLRALRLTAVARVEDIERLLAMPAMKQIRELSLEASRSLGKKHCQVLAASPVLAQLERLELRGVLGDPGAKALAASTQLSKLPVLQLPGCCIEPDGAEALGTARMPALRVLDLSGNPFSARGAHPIVHSKALTGLVDLDLSSCALGKQGGEIVAGVSARAPQLEVLRLAANKLEDSNAAKFLAAKHFAKLRVLDLSGNAIGSEIQAQLAKRFPS